MLFTLQIPGKFRLLASEDPVPREIKARDIYISIDRAHLGELVFEHVRVGSLEAESGFWCTAGNICDGAIVNITYLSE